MYKNYLLIFIYAYSSILYSQKNNEIHTLYIKFDQILNLDDVEDVFKIEGFNEAKTEYPFTIKKGITLSKKKIEKLSRGNHSIKNIFKIETQLSLDETQHLILELKSLKNVEYCYKTGQTPNRLPTPPPHDISPTTPNFEANQGYIESDPGVNMRYAWTQNVNGAGINIRVIEFGLNINHEDLDHTNIRIASGMTIHPDASESFTEHGTLVAGVIYADHGLYGASGLAFNANEYVLYPEWTEEHDWNKRLAVAKAIENSKEGDIIIFESQMDVSYPEARYVPIEFDQIIWDLTKAATDNGIIIIAAAGNGNENLDDPFYFDYLGRGDSGAIIVGAGSSNKGHSSNLGSTYGSRVNVQGWGSNVFTTGFGDHPIVIDGDINQSYSQDMRGTSSATAIVGGCATVLQSYYYSLTEDYLTSIELRDILINTGVPQGSGGHIGPLPNMETAMNAIDQLLDVKTYGQEEFYIIPNPASDFIHITIKDNFSNKNSEITIYNLLGQKVLKKELQTNNSKINIREIKNGVYILKLENGRNQITKKIIIN